MYVLKWTSYYKQDNGIHHYHIYQNIWSAEVDEHFVCERKPLNSNERYAVAVLKDRYRCGQLLQILSFLCWKMVQLIVWLLVEEDLPQGGLEIPYKLIFNGNGDYIKKFSEISSVL